MQSSETSKIFTGLSTNPQCKHPSQEDLDLCPTPEKDLIQIAGYLNLVSYKKHCSWTWKPYNTLGLLVIVTGSYPDAHSIGQEISTSTSFHIKFEKIWDDGPKVIWEKMYEAFKQLELHELGEFFMVGDQRPHDPHKLPDPCVNCGPPGVMK